MTTIVVDDDQSNRQRVQEMLERAGHRTGGFETADTARAALIDQRMDCRLVVTDVHMPGDNHGIDLALALAQSRPELPVIVMSAAAYELDRARAVGLAGPKLLKPVYGLELRNAVREAIACSRAGGFADPTRVIALMFGEAQAAGDPHVGSEHLALAALRGPLGLEELASRADVDPGSLRRTLVTCCHQPMVAGEVGATLRVTRLVAVASHIASSDGSREVESCHLVRALLTAPGAVAGTGHQLSGSTVTPCRDW